MTDGTVDGGGNDGGNDGGQEMQSTRAVHSGISRVTQTQVFPTFSMLGWSPKVKLLGIVVAEVLRPDALPVTEPTASNH